LCGLQRDTKFPLVGFTSNGQLLTEQHLEQFVQDGLDELTLSVHGVTKETYEKFMAGSSYEKFHQVLTMLDDVKQRNSSSKPNLRMNYTVNKGNLEELENFFDVFGKYSISTLQVRPIMDIGGAYRTVLDEQDVPRYKKVIESLRKECTQRNIVLLANIADPRFEQVNVSSVILQAVRRYISPEVVWRKDFNWRTESYAEFCHRIGWNHYLFRCVFSNLEKVMEQNSGFSGKYATKYDVFA
jgi:MoaA/NifB/PqqE/SkfB family radical SAM enzyme